MMMVMITLIVTMAIIELGMMMHGRGLEMARQIACAAF